MNKTVTIALPIYKRLQFLPQVLRVIAAQDYPKLELLVSDNGGNGAKLRDLVSSHYPRPYSYRENPETVVVAEHFNQILRAAQGEYFIIFGDDDELSPNFVSELVSAMERHPTAAIAFSRQELISESGVVLGKSVDVFPEMISGAEFILAAWQTYRFGFQSVSTFLTKTKAMLASGGYPNFVRGIHIDDAVVTKMCLRGHVTFSADCVFRKLIQESGMGWSLDIRELERATRQFDRFLRDDPAVLAYSAAHPAQWPVLRECLVEMAWQTYLGRWRGIYRGRMPYWRWLRAALALPLKRAYYRDALRTVAEPIRGAIPPRKGAKQPSPTPSV